MPNRRITFTLRTLLAIVVLASLVAAMVRYWINYESVFLIVEIKNINGTIYLDNKPLGSSPLSLTRRELIAACGGKANVIVGRWGPEVSAHEAGATVSGIRKRDGTFPLIWVAHNDRFRSILTPYGEAMLVDSSTMYDHEQRGMVSHIWFEPVNRTTSDIELRANSLGNGANPRCEIVVPANLAGMLEQAIRVRVNLRTPKSSLLHSLKASFSSSDWKHEGDTLVASIELPLLEPGFYWLDGHIEERGGADFATDDGQLPPKVISTAFEIAPLGKIDKGTTLKPNHRH